MKKKPTITLVVLFGILVCIGAFLLKDLFTGLYYKATLPHLNVATSDLSSIKDGIYKGAYNGHLVSAKVTVIIENHQIIDIILDEHDNQRGQAAEIIIEKIIEAQSLDVDAISGATQSSKVILKAVENALNNDIKE